MPPERVCFCRPTRYQELEASNPALARISSGLRLLTTAKTTIRMARTQQAGFQNSRNGKRPRRAIDKAASIIGPPAIAQIMPTGKKHQGMIHGKTIRFSQNRFVLKPTMSAKNQPNMIDCKKGQ